MSTLLRLPLELLIEIAKLVPEPIRLTLVCRLLNDVATPLSYQTLILPCPHGQVGRCFAEPGTIARTLGRLLRTMMAQPPLGMHVQQLKVSFADIPLPRERECSELATKIPEDIRISAVEAASSHGFGESVRGQLADGLLGAALLLLLCHFPNLHSLNLIPEFGGDFFRHIATSRILPCGLRSLRSVYIHEPNSRKDIEHKDIFALFCLPSLRTIRCQIFEPRNSTSTLDYQMVLFGGTSQIEDINIETTHVDTWVLETMVRSVQRLRSFRYDDDNELGDEPFSGTLLGDALQAHAHTLENLDIHVIKIEYERHSSIGSLRSYTKLTRLAITMPMLLGDPDAQPITELRHPRRIYELLPESLITFELYITRNWQHAACGLIAQFIEIDLKQVPNLKQILFPGWAMALDTTALQATCVASGITLRMRHSHSASSGT